MDKVNRVVTLGDVSITKQNFPTLPNNGSGYTAGLSKDLPWNKTIALDLLQDDLAITNAAAQQKTYELQNNPPIIYYSMKPSVLALIDGQPVLQASADNLQKVVNTRALILFDPKKKTYYLALMDGWLKAQSVEGPWSLARREPTKDLNLPSDFANIPPYRSAFGRTARVVYFEFTLISGVGADVRFG